jgi:hypothetical protein
VGWFLWGFKGVLAAHTWEANQATYPLYASTFGCMQESPWLANQILNARATSALKTMELYYILVELWRGEVLG